MPEIILPSPMVGLLAAFEPCFHAPSYRIFRLVLAGWMHCLGRRTVTGIALASGGANGAALHRLHSHFCEIGDSPLFSYRRPASIFCSRVAGLGRVPIGVYLRIGSPR